MANTQDRRVKYTKLFLKESLISLMKEKPISKISIKELCEKADVNRSTFYMHYTSQYALLQQIEDEIIAEINEKLNRVRQNQPASELHRILCSLFEYIADNKETCQTLLSETGDVDFLKKTMMLVQKELMEEWVSHMHLDQETAEYTILFMINGSIGIVQQWLKTDLRKSIPEMTTIIVQLVNQGLSVYLPGPQSE